MLGSWHYLNMTRFPFWGIYSQYAPVMKACERGTLFPLKVYERPTFSVSQNGIQSCKGLVVSGQSPFIKFCKDPAAPQKWSSRNEIEWPNFETKIV